MSTAARWLRRAAWAAGASCAALALALGALALHNARASRAFWARPDPRGRLVELGSRRVFASVSGLREQRGPSVVLIAGFGPSAEWWTLADMIAPHAAVLGYDRNGYGYSNGSSSLSTAHDAAAASDELLALLDRLALPAPYVLVGESVGALYAQHFARAHPERVAGVVLVDPITTEQRELERQLPRAIYRNLIDVRSRVAAGRVFAALGLVRELRALPYEHPPRTQREALLEFYASDHDYAAMLAEHAALARSIRQVETAGAFPDRPLTVIQRCPQCLLRELTAFELPYDDALYVQTLSDRLAGRAAALSPHGRLIFGTRATRSLPLLEPETIVHAVLELLDQRPAS